MSKKNDFIDIAEIENKFDRVLSMTADDVGFQIEQAFETAISKFYSDYDPSSYDRTDSMFLLSSGYNDYSTLSKKNGKFRYEAGIRVSPDNVPGNPYAKNPRHGIPVDPAFVFDVSYLKGIHGFNRKNVLYTRKPKAGVMGDVPESSIWEARKDKWRPGYYDVSITSSFINFGSSGEARHKAYQSAQSAFDKFYDVRKHIPTNSTPPAVLMQRDFKKIEKSIGLALDRAFASIF